MGCYHLGVDVGTGSARVGVFSEQGQLLETRSKEIKINNPSHGVYEQSSQDIWDAVKEIVQDATKSLDKSKILDLSFCATCSLVAVDSCGKPVSISEGGDPAWDIIMWMDHRANKEAEQINRNQKGHKVLDFVGGKISLEMQTPKLLWLKNNLKQSYDKTQEFFDLPDFLRWKATGSLKRSICSIVCKWTHISSPEGNYWDKSYFKEIGLEDALPKIGDTFSHPGQDFDLLCPQAVKELGLHPNVKVGYSMIDAHSGVLGMMGCKVNNDPIDFTKRLALICGTSNCHMALSKEPCRVQGVWGPYYGVIFPHLNLNEGGQSAAGKLLDHVVATHPAYPKMLKQAGNNHGKLLSLLETLLGEGQDVAELTKDLHIWPDFHGNRSPIADPTLKGMMCGLTLSDSEKDLAILYLATIQAIGYGSLHILNELKKNGHNFEAVVICGGLAKSRIFLQTHADILKLPVLVPTCPEPVLLGAAISAATASATSGKDAEKVMATVVAKMCGDATVIQPNHGDFRYHEKKHKIFLEMVRDQLKYREIMRSSTDI